jgi:hypothetical protein
VHGRSPYQSIEFEEENADEEQQIKAEPHERNFNPAAGLNLRFSVFAINLQDLTPGIHKEFAEKSKNELNRLYSHLGLRLSEQSWEKRADGV